VHQPKAEKLEVRPTFSEAFQQRRCVVPADGFYEWAGAKSKRQPFWIHQRKGGLMLFAGLYECWYPEKDRLEVTFTIATCAANATRKFTTACQWCSMSVPRNWMNPLERDPLSLKHLMVPAPADLLVRRPASPLVNSVKNEGAALLEAGVTQNMVAR
jgi:putative SOS response-associated peptidase YedK